MTETHTQLEADIAELIRTPIAELGFDVLRIKVASGVLQVMAEPQDHTADMTVEDCARISREISPNLEASNKMRSHYRLEVTTPGIARPLFTRADYQRFSGQFVKISTRELVDGRRRFSGRLLGLMADDRVMLDTGFGRVSVDYGLVESAKLDAAAVLADTKSNRRTA